MRRFVPTSLVLGIVSVPAAFAGVLRVASSGTPFPTIQSAVDAGVDGDVILVAPGDYPGFTIHDESLVIAVDPPGIATCGAVHVEDIATSRNVLLSRLRVQASSGDGLSVTTCQGSVRVVGCRLTGANQSFSPVAVALGSGAYVSGSPDVVLRDCIVVGGHGVDDWSAYPPGAPALFTRGSTIALYGSTLTGGRGGNAPSDSQYDGGPGGPALETPSSFVLAQATSFTGGAGGVGGDGDVFHGGDGGPGGSGAKLLAAIPSTLPELVLRASTLSGGVGGAGGFSGGPGAAGAPSTVSTGSIAFAGGEPLDVTTSAVWRSGTAQTIVLHAPAGSHVALYLARDTGFAFDAASGYALHLAPPIVRRAGLGSVPASGTITLTFTVPTLPAGVDAQPWYLQAFVTPLGGMPTSALAAAVVLAPGV